MSEIHTTTNLFELEVASGDTMSVRRFEATERMSALFRIDLIAMSPNHDVDLDAVVGKPARFTIGRVHEAEISRTWTGIVTELRQIAVDEVGLSTYELTLAPALWLLTQRRNYRIFQRMSDVEVVQKVLSEWGIVPELALSDTYAKREYRVQYGETDYAFVCRMLEDAGVSFYFVTEEGQTRLRLHDVPNNAEARPPLRFFDKPWKQDPSYVTDVRVGRRVRPGKYTMRDVDHRRAATYKLGGSAASGGDEDALERYHYAPGAFVYESDRGESTPISDDKGKFRADDAAGAALAQRRLEAQRADKKQISFKTGVFDLGPGVVFSVLDHPKSELAPGKKLLVVASSMSGTNEEEIVHACESVPADARYRPPLETPKPKVNGVEIATVVGPPGEEIHTDEFGRARVQFRWDRMGNMDEKSSCWVPVSHAWGGAGYGWVNHARVGQEVIVDFLGGDPDRPIIVGRVHTNTEKVPYTLPANKTQSGWKSNSSPGGGGYNEMMFEDAAGRELVRMQAQKDHDKLVKHDETVTIGNDRSKSVGNDDSLSVGNNRSRMVGNNESVTVGSNQTVTVGSNHTTTVGANQTLTVLANQKITLPSGNQTESITGNRTFTLDGHLHETHTGNHAHTLAGDFSDTHTGNRADMHTGNRTDTHQGNRTDTHTGNRSDMHTGSRTDAHQGSRTDTHTGTRTDTQAGDRTDTQAGNRSVAVSGTLDEKVGGAHTRTTGPSTETVKGPKTVSASGILSVSGPSIDVSSPGTITLKGSIIKLNC